ncbi:MAG: hypothetical protein QNJ03_04640 [Dinoroseobacter sp.]|nr:hypothetical protein [Dinoroseobacter sp.]
MTIEELATFFGWMTVVNLIIYLLAVLSMFTMRDLVLRLHTGVFDIPEARVRELWYSWLGSYKIIILALNIAPYLALRLAA